MDQPRRVFASVRDRAGDDMTVGLVLASIWGVSVVAFGWLMWVEVIRPELRFRRVEAKRDAEDKVVGLLDACWELPSFDSEATA